MRNQRGQFILEAILLMVIFMGLLGLVSSYFNREGILAKLVKAPWVGLAGMLQNGVWLPTDKGQPLHPSFHHRHVTIEGEPVAPNGNSDNYYLGQP